MLVFLDTEFTDFADCELISIGMITEDGCHELYLEVQDFRREACNYFVQSTVWAHLGKFPRAIVPKAEINAHLRAWFSTLGDITLAYDSQRDIDLLTVALGGGWPSNIIGYLDLRAAMESEIFQITATKDHSEQRPWHHALFDSKAHRAGWLAFVDAQHGCEVLSCNTDQKDLHLESFGTVNGDGSADQG